MSDTSAESAPKKDIGDSASQLSGDASDIKEVVTEKCKYGMKSGVKALYSGKEDNGGRFKWQDTIPEDVGDPAENEETAKWAILVRNIKVYNDPRRVLRLHSIVIQSPLLKRFLGNVLKGYPGVTVGLDRLEFNGKFEPLIHRWTELGDAIDRLGDNTEVHRTTKVHAQLLQEALVKEFKVLIDTSRDMKRKRVMTSEYLWTLFAPGTTVFTREEGQESALTVVTVSNSDIRCEYVDWDGTDFGLRNECLEFPQYAGTRSITALTFYPIEFHSDREALIKRLTDRGTTAEALAGANYRSYQGMAWRVVSGEVERYNIKGRIVIDTYGWNRFVPAQIIHVCPTRTIHVPAFKKDATGSDSTKDFCEEASADESDVDYGLLPDAAFADEKDASERLPLTNEHKLIYTPLVRGYSLKEKLWLNFFVSCVHDISWQEDAFERLVLPKNQKELILGFTESQRKLKGSFDDIIEGKGRGMIILLCGPPGVGKTLTGEAVAEEMRVPLYLMSAGDLGYDPESVEMTLEDILNMCTRWNAVLLLDEADVFLEVRSMHELERNKLVSIFLRVLEYYEGTMFLTTNRVHTFDPAFQSRIHISLDYPELSIDSRATIWLNFLSCPSSKSDAPTHVLTKAQLTELARLKMNGRQIKNIIKVALLLASSKEEPLAYEHIITTMEVTQHLHNEREFLEKTRGTLYT